MPNGFIESFNGRMRDELLNETLFFELDHEWKAIAKRITVYNYLRALSLPQIKSGHNSDGVRRAVERVGCGEPTLWNDLSAQPCQARDGFGPGCDIGRMSGRYVGGG